MYGASPRIERHRLAEIRRAPVGRRIDRRLLPERVEPCSVLGYAPLSRRYASSAAPSISICDLAVALLAAPTCWKMFGATSVARIAITTMTTRISISVKPERIGSGVGGVGDGASSIWKGSSVLGWTPEKWKQFSRLDLAERRGPGSQG